MSGARNHRQARHSWAGADDVQQRHRLGFQLGEQRPRHGVDRCHVGPPGCHCTHALEMRAGLDDHRRAATPCVLKADPPRQAVGAVDRCNDIGSGAQHVERRVLSTHQHRAVRTVDSARHVVVECADHRHLLAQRRDQRPTARLRQQQVRVVPHLGRHDNPLQRGGAPAEVLAHHRPQRVSGATQRGERVHRQRRHRHLGGHQAMPREPYGRAPGDNGWSGWQNGCRK